MYQKKFKKNKEHRNPYKSFSQNPLSPTSKSRKKYASGYTIDPSLLVKKAVPVEQITYQPSRLMTDLPVHTNLLEIIGRKGYTHPTEIQDKAIEHIVAGRDLMGIAQTGTGKTAAYLIPIIHNLISDKQGGKALVIVPTRELALQVETEFKTMSKGLNLFSINLIGGKSVMNDMEKLRRNFHLIVATPGRLIDMLKRRAVDLREYPVLVIDEFDRMLDMGFAEDVKRIIQAMGQRKQTLLFSATLDKTQEKLIAGILNNPIDIRTTSGKVTCDSIDQDVLFVENGGSKYDMLVDLLLQKECEKVLLFAETRRTVDKLTRQLKLSNVAVDYLHGDKSQRSRQDSLEKFRSGKIQVLVATDVAARGLDVTDVSHVINYTIPTTYDSYIHRIGRTGRAGKTGKALTFIN